MSKEIYLMYKELKNAIWQVPGEPEEDHELMTQLDTLRQAKDQALAYEQCEALRLENEQLKKQIQRLNNILSALRRIKK